MPSSAIRGCPAALRCPASRASPARASAVVAGLLLVHDDWRLRAELEEMQTRLHRDAAEWAQAYAKAVRAHPPPNPHDPDPPPRRATAGGGAECRAQLAMASEALLRAERCESRLRKTADRPGGPQKCRPCRPPTGAVMVDGTARCPSPPPCPQPSLPQWGGGGGGYSGLSLRQGGRVPVLPRTSPGGEALWRTVWLCWGLWDDGDMPWQAKKVVERFGTLNPGWEVKVVGRADAQNLIDAEYPELAEDWKHATAIQRADLLRLLLVLKHGGLYADLDAIFEDGIAEILAASGFDAKRHDAAFFTETVLDEDQHRSSVQHPLRQGVAELATRLANYALYAAPGTPALRSVVALALYRLRRQRALLPQQRRGEEIESYEPIYVAGPDCVTEAVFGGLHASVLPRVLIVSLNAAKRITNHGMGTWRDAASQWRKSWDSLAERHQVSQPGIRGFLR